MASPIYSCPDLDNNDKQTLGQMVQGDDGWFFRSEGDLREDFTLYQEAQDYMTRLVHGLRARGTTLAFVSVPSKGIIASQHLPEDHEDIRRYQVDQARASYEEFITAMRSTGLIIPNMQHYITNENISAETFFFRRDHHWTSHGARAGAKTIAASLKSHPAYASISPQKYVTAQTGEQLMKHTMALELQRLCGTEMPAELYPRYATSLAGDASSGADALFGDTDDSDEASVMIGSSFSAEREFNFEGFLAEETGLTLANHAVTGGLLYNSIVSYVSSPDFDTARPPFIIWEAPAVYNVNKNVAGYFRQILPALHGMCTGENIIATNELTIRSGTPNEALFTPKATQAISGKDYYVILNTPNRSLTKFTLIADYDDGDGEWFNVDRSEFFDNEGRFFIELSDDITSNLTSLSIERISNVNAKLSATLCRVPADALSHQPVSVSLKDTL